MTEAFNRGDVKSCAAYYAEYALMFLPDRPPIKGREAIEAILLEFSMAGMKLALVEPDQIRSSGDMGYGAGTYRFEVEATPGDVTLETGRFVTVLMRQADGSWKAVIDSLMRDAT